MTDNVHGRTHSCSCRALVQNTIFTYHILPTFSPPRMSKYFNENKGGEIIESFYETGEINETYNSLINNVEVFLLYSSHTKVQSKNRVI